MNVSERKYDSSLFPYQTVNSVGVLTMACVNDSMLATEATFKKIIEGSGFLGKGNYGEVYGPCGWQGRECAIKRRVFDKRELGEQMEKEIEACSKWKSLNHRNLIKVFNAACDANFNPPAMYICMEFARGGSVEDALKKVTTPLPIDVVKDWAKQVASGMTYLHGNSVVHRDLKSANIVISENFELNELTGKTLKITDFDCIRDHHHTVVMSFRGTFTWMAPEVRARSTFSKASDVWSYGVLVWAMLTGKETTEMQFDIPETAPDDLKYLIKNCMNRDTSKRPTFTLIDNWFEKPEITVTVVEANNRSRIIRISADSTVDHLLTKVSEVFGYQGTAADIGLGFEDTKPLNFGSGRTIWQAGIKQNSTLVLIVRQSGGYEVLL